MVIRKQEEAAEEIIGGAVARMAGRAPDREIQVEAPEEVLMVPMDAKLIMQVLINLMDNAVKHTDGAEEIKVTVKKICRGKMPYLLWPTGEKALLRRICRIFSRPFIPRRSSRWMSRRESGWG